MCFFFFKQKTAYERRISDGSSDVCSSDLAWEAGEWECADLTALFANFGDNAVSLGNIGRAKGPFRWAARLAHYFNRNSRAGAMRNIRAHYDQIGRASGRERVCQYVSISVVDVS